jgi:hypothetical protein
MTAKLDGILLDQYVRQLMHFDNPPLRFPAMSMSVAEVYCEKCRKSWHRRDEPCKTSIDYGPRFSDDGRDPYHYNRK